MPEENIFRGYPDLAAKLFGLTASISVAASLIFDWGFFFALDLSFLEVPSTLSDHVRSALIWFPKVLTAFAIYSVYEILSKRIEKGMTEEEIINSSVDPARTARFRDGPYKLGAFTAAILVVAYILLGDIFLSALPFGLGVLWMMFSAWAQNHPRIVERRPLHLRIAVLCLPPISIWLFFSGYIDAVRSFEKTVPNAKITLVSEAATIPAVLLRQLERGIIIKDKGNIVTFHPWNEVRKIETSAKYVPSRGVLCAWFSVSCNNIPVAAFRSQEAQSNPSVQSELRRATPP